MTRNQEVYDDYWTQRWRRLRTYSIQGKLKRFRRMMRRARLLDRPDFAVFELGFGLGAMLLEFDPACAIAGTELADAPVAALRSIAARRGFRAVDLRAHAVGQPYPPEWHARFDLVICSHVLEHLDQPALALQKLLSLLKPGGLACIIVPVNEQPGDDLNHFQWFTEASFRTLLVDAGLQDVRLESCDRIFNFARPLARRLHVHPTRIDRVKSIGFNAVFGLAPGWFLKFCDEVLLPKHWPCCQCFGIARKMP